MDFVEIKTRETKKGIELYPSFKTTRPKDILTRGGSFYAFWDEGRGVWNTRQSDLQNAIDSLLWNEREKLSGEMVIAKVHLMNDYESGILTEFNRYCKEMPENYVALDSKLVFADQETKRKDYSSKRLSYAIEQGATESWELLISTLYSEEERRKIEWAIGSIVAGDSIKLQKFFALYGGPGTGKSTILNIIEMLFEGYVAHFDAKSLGSYSSQFSTAAFKNNPLVAIQHDGDLSRIFDNSKLNSIVAHEPILVNEKFVKGYLVTPRALLFLGTNKEIEITDAKSGLLRRLIEIQPTGTILPPSVYDQAMANIKFELGAIAYRCLHLYRALGKDYYKEYIPKLMQEKTDPFYNFVEANFDVFKEQDFTTLTQAWSLYKEWCEESGIDNHLKMFTFREELKEYFEEYHDRILVGDERRRKCYVGFKRLNATIKIMESKTNQIVLHPIDPVYDTSILDKHLADCPAQYAKETSGDPGYKWENVKTTLRDIEPNKLHFVKVPENHIVVDFDLVNEDGEKDLELNLRAASDWPATYAEVSKSGKGLHLHYIYAGDVHTLASVYDVGIEIKTLLGGASLRRKLTRASHTPISKISGGLPLKEKPVLDLNHIKTEKGLRELIERNLRKEIHPGTKSSIDFIHHILEETYNSGVSYDVTDMRQIIIAFAARSTNQAAYCLKLVQKMKFASEDRMPDKNDDDSGLVFFDIEVYPNLLVVCWKSEDSPMTQDSVAKLINPSPQEIEDLFKFKLVGFNNRRYDNHMLYARFLGLSVEDIYRKSSRIINDNDRSQLYGEAYNLSYTDIYDFSSKKQSLKKFEIELGILHMELDIPWDKPVPEELWPRVVEYCANDVLATQATFEARKQDFVARQILSELSGLSVNHTTLNHTAKIIFGNDRKPQDKFVYTDLSEMFPGYSFHGKESSYRGESPGEGGYVYAEPGIYENVVLLDVASMHPTSIEQLNLFGPYTKNFSALKEARLAIKHKDYERARDSSILGGKLGKFLVGAEDDPSRGEALSYALKIVINIVYGLTSASFDNPFRDIRNLDNIVAKRGALFMIDLKHEVQKRGFTVAHIKTDSIKIPNATQEIIDFIFEFGKQYGYDFEHEETYSKFCLVNDAVYIARGSQDKWTAVGAQFQIPYVYKKLFSHEQIEFDDICVAKSVAQGSMYLDPNDSEDIEEMLHVGRTGSFVPVTSGGGTLWRIKDGKKYAVTGTKGYRWITHDVAAQRNENYESFVDLSYFEEMVQAAVDAINKFGSFDHFIA